jgi:hypothetical protein
MNTIRRFVLFPSFAGICLVALAAIGQGTPSAVGGGVKPPPLKIKAANPYHPPIVTVIKKDFDEARGWRITWKSVAGSDPTPQNKVQSIFSTVTGAVNSVDYLNGVSAKNTDNADMMLYFGDLRSTHKVPQLTHKSGLKKTQFKLSGMKVADLEDAAKNDPNKFGVIYTLAFDAAGEVKENYKEGQIYVFKTDRTPAKYGAVRIVSMSPRIIEVVVQK